jgi:hypothetical protein
MTTAPAPSQIPDADPAVTTPPETGANGLITQGQGRKFYLPQMLIMINFLTIKEIMAKPMVGKAKTRCHLSMLKMKLRHSYLNVMKLENYGSKL